MGRGGVKRTRAGRFGNPPAQFVARSTGSSSDHRHRSNQRRGAGERENAETGGQPPRVTAEPADAAFSKTLALG